MIKTFAAISFLAAVATAALGADTRKLELRVVDDNGIPLPCRVHLFDDAGKPVQPGTAPFFRDHFVCGGAMDLELPVGSYRYEIARGPEYQEAQAEFKLETSDNDRFKLNVTLSRISEVRKQGWFSADLHIHRPIEHIEQLMLAEDLDFGPVITWWNKNNPWKQMAIPDLRLRRFDGHRLYHIMAGEDEREGGALLFFGLEKPIDITQADREFPSPMKFVALAESANRDVWIDIEKPFWWDVPVWLASGRVDSMGIANNHMNRRGMYENEAWGRPRDVDRLPNPLGNGYWTQEIYYHALNTGLRIPPSAGSASGVLPNPVGYNRVYAQLDGEFTHDKWWSALRAGRCFVTNGPILLCRANKQLPGHVFKSNEALSIQLDIELTCTEDMKYLELIHNGQAVASLPYDNGKRTQAEFKFDRSGWFLIRAIVDNDKTFRFASTAPFYLEIGAHQKFVSRDSVRFFQDWVEARMLRVNTNVDDPVKQQQVMKYHLDARRYYKALAESAVE